MKVLVLSVDRDNDFGRKAGVASPIIGKEENVKAAVALGTKDPEDSDSNAVLAAISAYDQLVAAGRETEIATICGDLNVGIFSDSILAKQLESVIAATGATSAVLVTDGGEDEYILPIIQSRLKIDSIKKITMKQTQSIQDTFYIFRKMLDDEKIQRKFVIPIALVLVVWGIAALAGQPNIGLGAVVLVVGVYLFEKALHFSERIKKISHEKVTLAVFLIAIGLITVGAITTYISIMDVQNAQGYAITKIQTVALIASGMTWWVISAVLSVLMGRIIDDLIMERNPLWHASAPFTAMMFGFIIPPLSSIILYFIEPRSFESKNIYSELIWIAAGLSFGIIGAFINGLVAKRIKQNGAAKEEKTQ
jgi:putative membrane protein